jgi:hypothetical protein
VPPDPQPDHFHEQIAQSAGEEGRGKTPDCYVTRPDPQPEQTDSNPNPYCAICDNWGDHPTDRHREPDPQPERHGEQCHCHLYIKKNVGWFECPVHGRVHPERHGERCPHTAGPNAGVTGYHCPRCGVTEGSPPTDAVEAVAKALYEGSARVLAPWEQLGTTTRERFVDRARLAITAYEAVRGERAWKWVAHELANEHGARRVDQFGRSLEDAPLERLALALADYEARVRGERERQLKEAIRRVRRELVAPGRHWQHSLNEAMGILTSALSSPSRDREDE